MSNYLNTNLPNTNLDEILESLFSCTSDPSESSDETSTPSSAYGDTPHILDTSSPESKNDVDTNNRNNGCVDLLNNYINNLKATSNTKDLNKDNTINNTIKHEEGSLFKDKQLFHDLLKISEALYQSMTSHNAEDATKTNKSTIKGNDEDNDEPSSLRRVYTDIQRIFNNPKYDIFNKYYLNIKNIDELPKVFNSLLDLLVSYNEENDNLRTRNDKLLNEVYDLSNSKNNSHNVINDTLMSDNVRMSKELDELKSTIEDIIWNTDELPEPYKVDKTKDARNNLIRYNRFLKDLYLQSIGELNLRKKMKDSVDGIVKRKNEKLKNENEKLKKNNEKLKEQIANISKERNQVKKVTSYASDFDDLFKLFNIW